MYYCLSDMHAHPIINNFYLRTCTFLSDSEAAGYRSDEAVDLYTEGAWFAFLP